MLRILGSEINLTHKALEIYVAGCTRQCPGCHNPEAHSFARGQRFDKWLAANRHKLTSLLGLEHVWVMGGDLLCQPDPAVAEEFLSSLRRVMPDNMLLWLWTGAERQDVPPGLLRHVDVCKTGPYRKELPQKTIDSPAGQLTLASNNQEVWRVADETPAVPAC